MTEMQYRIGDGPWLPIYDDMPSNSTIPKGVTQVYFRQKPKFSANLSITNSRGSFEENFDDRGLLYIRLSELDGNNVDYNLYIRNR
jgi:hypothetical protein